MTWGPKISPDRVLYEFDGPCIFSRSYGPFNAIFLKIDEERSRSTFIACFITEKKLTAIAEGKVSVRSAFMERDKISVIETDHLLKVLREKTFAESGLSMDVLPSSGMALFEHYGRVPDVLPKEDAILSIYYRGEGLSEDRMSFTRFATLTNRTFHFLKSTFLPPKIRAAAGNYLDINIAEPEFGSLMFSVEGVEFNTEAASRSKNARDAIDKFNDDLLESRRKRFYQDMLKLKDASAVTGNSPSLASLSDRIDVLSEIMPRSTLGLDEVQFLFSSSEGNERISFNTTEASALAKARDEIAGQPIRKNGEVVEINTASQTFLIENDFGRQTTCSCGMDTFNELMRMNTFRLGAEVELFGDFTVRSRRDLLDVHQVIEVRPPSQSDE